MLWRKCFELEDTQTLSLIATTFKDSSALFLGTVDQNRIANILVNKSCFCFHCTEPNRASKVYINKYYFPRKRCCKISVRDAAIGQEPNLFHHKVRERERKKKIKNYLDINVKEKLENSGFLDAVIVLIPVLFCSGEGCGYLVIRETILETLFPWLPFLIGYLFKEPGILSNIASSAVEGFLSSRNFKWSQRKIFFRL